ncbi:MAG: hypothetical protein QRY74_02545 [Chlamydia sp.]
MAFRTDFIYRWNSNICNNLEKAAIDSPKMARFRAAPLFAYALFEKAVSPFVSLCRDYQKIKALKEELANTSLEAERRSDLELTKRIVSISMIKNIGCILTLPLYILIRAVYFVAQIVINPLTAAKRGHPSYAALLEELSLYEGPLRRELLALGIDDIEEEFKQRLSALQEHINSLSIQSLQKMHAISNPIDKFDRARDFFDFKIKMKADPKYESAFLDRAFKAMEEDLYSSNSIDMLFQWIGKKIALLEKIDLYQSPYLERAVGVVKQYIAQIFQEKEFRFYRDSNGAQILEPEMLYKNSENYIQNLLRLYHMERKKQKEIKSDGERDALRLGVESVEAMIMRLDISSTDQIEDAFSNGYTCFKLRGELACVVDQYKKDELTSKSSHETKNLAAVCNSLQKSIHNIANITIYEGIDFNCQIKPIIPLLQTLFSDYIDQLKRERLVTNAMEIVKNGQTLDATVLKERVEEESEKF